MRNKFFVLLAASGCLFYGCDSGSGTQNVMTTQTPANSDAGQVTAQTTEVVPNNSEISKVSKNTQPKYNELTAEEERIILHKGTERINIGEYTDLEDKGTYICRRCNAQLYRSSDKFHSGCGWPAFDDQIGDSVIEQVDADGYRTEILCRNCGGHLGHVFRGELMTAKNTRHCVNSLSMRFIPDGQEIPDKITAE